ncbi:O-antigen ligase family protein [Hamadaea tsunoensis]|uniref:O-antigen ligase family protein n=1 Tax=Hamadaea tsunoensis TaxID=53368 RepID=UPI000421562A|nr:O-antigen ligase family protein [Hamadaea tsunoensis]
MSLASPAGRTTARRLSRLLSIVLLALLAILLVEVFLETWTQVLTGPTSTDPRVNLELASQWPKTLKNALYFGLAAVTFAKIAVDRRWKSFRTPADLALAALVVVLVLAGLVNGSSPKLMADALFVYLRGALVFYALRSADVTPRTGRRLMTVAGVLVGVNVLLALLQMIIGEPAYRMLGWVDLTWAGQYRAQGLLPHPNHLGHVLGLVLLGLLAFMVSRPLPRWWWAVLVPPAIALSATQSRESLIGVVLGAVVIGLVARTPPKKIVVFCLVIVACTGLQIVARPANRAEWERRIGNVFTAFRHPASTTSHQPVASKPATTPRPSPQPEETTSAAPSARPSRSPSKAASPTPQVSHSPSPAPVREIRVLYFQQSFELWQKQPLLGFGIGQFGGVVAQKNNPDWDKNPKFGPKGFNRYGFQAVQIDSFWLHLGMEAGLLGLLAYAAWLWMLVRPLLQSTRSTGRERRRPRDPLVLWAIAVMPFVALVAVLSPAYEDPLLPPLLFGILGFAWWSLESAAQARLRALTAETTQLPSMRDGRAADETVILSTDEIRALARNPRRDERINGSGAPQP